MSYFKYTIAPVLSRFGTSKSQISDTSPDLSDLKRLIFLINDARDALTTLEEVNKPSTRENFYYAFNTLISQGSQTEMRVQLINTFLRNQGVEELDSFLRKISRGELKEHRILAIISHKIETAQLVSLIESNISAKDLTSTLVNTSKGLGYYITGDNRGLGSVKKTQDNAKRKSKERDKVIAKINGKYPSNVPSGIIQPSFDTTLQPKERENLENIVIMINVINHSEFIAALLQFRIDGLEKRIEELEKANQKSFFGFLIEFSVTFVLPFAIGKILEGAILKAALRNEQRTTQIIHKLKSGAKLAPYLDELTARTTGFAKLLNNLPPWLKNHIDDYGGFLIDTAIKFNKYRNQENKEQPKIESLQDFINYSIRNSREEILRLQNQIYSIGDVMLIEELKNKIGLGYEYFYSTMKKKQAELEKAEKRKRDEQIEKARIEAKKYKALGYK